MVVKSLQVNTCLVSSVCTRGIKYRGQERGLLTCYPDTDLSIAKELMEAKGIKQLPVIKRGREPRRRRKQRIAAILHYDSIWNCLRFFCAYDHIICFRLILFFLILVVFISVYFWSQTLKHLLHSYRIRSRYMSCIM